MLANHEHLQLTSVFLFRPNVAVRSSSQLSARCSNDNATDKAITDFPVPVAGHFLRDHIGDGDREGKETRESDIRGRLPANAQATTVLVGGHERLSCVVSAFIRFDTGCDLGDLAEVSIPVRFMFIMLGPEDLTLDYHEAGRAVATLMSDKVFLESAYHAQVSLTEVKTLFVR